MREKGSRHIMSHLVQQGPLRQREYDNYCECSILFLPILYLDEHFIEIVLNPLYASIPLTLKSK